MSEDAVGKKGLDFVKDFQWPITPKEGGEANFFVKEGSYSLSSLGLGKEICLLTSPQGSHFPGLFPTEASKQPKGEVREGTRKCPG